MKRLFIIITTTILFLAATAQRNTATLNFQLSLPQGDYKKTYPKTAYGLLIDLQIALFRKESKTPMLLVETGIRFKIFTKEI